MSRSGHTPVLLEETLALLDPQAGETALDCTVGLGGHAVEIARRLGPSGTLIINDLDPVNLAHAHQRLMDIPEAPRIVQLRGNFAQAPRQMAEQGLSADVALADLGFASTQVDDPQRGFSFSREGPLDMRLDPAAPVSAAELVNTASEGELFRIIREYGEEPRASRIAQKLVATRQAEPITTTTRLAEVIRSATGPKRPTDRIDPATRTFQALRIAVNDELGSLERLLDAVRRSATQGRGDSWLAPEARIGIISFHSLEDRPVKKCFRELVASGLARGATSKPVTAKESELMENARARSAKLRVIGLTRRRDAL